MISGLLKKGYRLTNKQGMFVLTKDLWTFEIPEFWYVGENGFAQIIWVEFGLFELTLLELLIRT